MDTVSDIAINITGEKLDPSHRNWWVTIEVKTPLYHLSYGISNDELERFWGGKSGCIESLTPIITQSLNAEWQIGYFELARDFDYDEHDSHIVWAGNAAHALVVTLVCAHRGSSETLDSWLKAEITRLDNLSPNGAIVHSSFHAG